ncbi:mitochondrial inner membrane protein OXA1-like isoform X1 [Oryza brachyantha]|uniref:mitochondrial inner membrane protein OXA1-like isoform X1 n=1 Tax=Oryza brachyantha TaxID=4533 RepID=UPI000776A64E|nr:mitochondrial inner membrane protein OXA1-like isoform X1 [Oryza brachyantha]
MAFAAAARRSLCSRLSDHLTRRLHPALPHLLVPHSSGDPQDHSPLQPPARLQPPHFPLYQSSRTAKTLSLLPLGIRLAGPPHRGFSSSPSSPAFDVGAVLTDAAGAAAAAAPVSFPSEVALAAENSSLSTAAVQHLIDAVHSSTGLNWWLSIAISTMLLRCLLLPLWIMAFRRLRVDDKKSEKEAIHGHVLLLFKRLGLLGFVPILKPYAFMTLYFSISNMVEKVPSLKEGGAFWFTDLTTPDALYIFPVMTSIFLMLRLEFSRHYSKQSRSNDKDVNRVMHVLRTLILLTIPLTASLPQAFSCYFVTWSFTSLMHRIAIRQPAVIKRLFGDLTVPTSTSPPSDESKEPAAEDPPMPIQRREQPHPIERTRTSDASVHRISDQSDQK